ncbi:1-acyl-sn-glycerol-3-phosphate acyltransferase [Actinocrinis puniceicyclus]|uniref:1-acyl-sn-glycerol-3-phosphate acyltransferase n=1 Tax=Actinocrinis puniceicyclus TaxID=977794 RepID=A0A8J7WKK9_9ACTN|nr:1-acyl-sn-glycerol-3-phosphate acyltransferase [Actinocrinis puniceicyclus]MBS2963033.1 1-acyl-sn-glycerol-3-phosphate acyltransferase [Actinocrinis puniceicyclus]
MRALLLRYTVLRRLLSIPVLLLIFAVTAVLTPVVVLFGGLWALRRGGRGRPVRIVLFAFCYLCMELVGLSGAGWLWLRAGCGCRIGSPRWQDAHYALLARLLGRLYRIGGALFDLHINAPTTVTDAGSSPALPPASGRPLLVFSRHAGPGDSFLLVHALSALARRRPRIVLKEALRFDPIIDVILSRLPHCFVGRGPDAGDRTAARIAHITASMGPADALLVFPEGGNFTPHRRLRAIASLRRRGLTHASAGARRLRNVLPPQPAGVFAAIDAAPHADLVFVAHTGLDHMQSSRQVWRGIPLVRPVEVTWWTIPTERVPLEHDARLRWLDGNWAEVDAWIGRVRQAEPLP